MDIMKASNKLSQLELEFAMDNVTIEILWFRAMTNRDEWCITMHTHSSFEFHFVAAGKCKVILEDGEFEAKKGEIYLTAPGVYHEQCSIDETGYYVEYSMNCDFSIIEDKNSEAQRMVNLLEKAKCKPFSDRFGILDYFNKALYEVENEEIGFYNNIKSIASMIIALAARTVNEDINIQEYSVPAKIKKDNYRFLQIKKYIEDNIGGHITTIDVANYMHLSDRQICRIVKEKTGESTKEFINSIKFAKAKKLLRETDLQIKEIANILGFSNEYYFNQFFKREEGYPPGVFRFNVKNV